MDNYIKCYENAVTDEFCDLVITKFESQYFEHEEWPKDKPFFSDLVSFITSGPVVVMQVEGENVVLQIRNLMGATNPSESTPGSIRGDLATELDKNVVHGSDSDESAERELSLFFGN